MKTKTSQFKTLVLFMVLLSVVPTAHAFYNPNTGRWLSRDSITYSTEPNVHAFLRGSPTSYVDVLGRYTYGDTSTGGENGGAGSGPKPIDPPAPNPPPGRRIEEYNCGGLALATHQWMTPADVQNKLNELGCQVIQCSDSCQNGMKVWLWTWKGSKYHRNPNGDWIQDATFYPDFHVVSLPCECNRCYSKTNIRPIEGPIDPNQAAPPAVTYPSPDVKIERVISRVCLKCNSTFVSK